MSFFNQYPQERSAYWDNIKGVLIALVVFAHCLYGLQNNYWNDVIVDAIYYFHMPAFVFVSGFFSKSENSRSLRSCLKLVSAYVFLEGGFALWDVVLGNTPNLITPYYSAWYLIALVVWRMLIPHIVKFKWALAVSTIVAVIAGYWPDFGGQPVFAIQKVVAFFPYFIAGYLLSREKAASIASKPVRVRVPLGIGCLALVAVGELASHRLLRITDSDLLPASYESFSLVEPLSRIAIMVVAALFIVAMLHLSVDRSVPLLTRMGKNSLAIYVLHRPFTLAFSPLLASCPDWAQLPSACAASALLLLALGSDAVSSLVNRVLNKSVSFLLHEKKGASLSDDAMDYLLPVFLAFVLVCPAIVKVTSGFLNPTQDDSSASPTDQVVVPVGVNPTTTEDQVFRAMTEEQEGGYDDAFTLLFAGDLILLEDQVKSAWTESGYDFSECFEYTRRYISAADYAVGVFEGPCGGAEIGYSTSNYRDGKDLHLNYPDEWAEAVKDAGFDMVTTANNHMLDKGVGAMERTVSVLDKIGLDHVGTYRDQQEKEDQSVKVVDVDGIKIAFLAYTFGSNGVEEDQLVEGDLSYATSMIVDPQSPNIDVANRRVEEDFEKARTEGCDLIVVLPHWGTEFLSEPDEIELYWRDRFLALGADVVLGDHPHHVQPVEVGGGAGGEKTFTLFCPGNYANVYREKDGDCSALVEVRVDRESKHVIGGDLIPMWTESSLTGNYRALPIYDILSDEGLGGQVSTYDLERIGQAQSLITSDMLGIEIGLNNVQERYFFDEDGFMRSKVEPLEITPDMAEGGAYRALTSAGSACFVGDSLTDGCKNGGVPWYEPLEQLVDGEVVNRGWGGATTVTLLRDHLDEIADVNADLFIVAVGANDVRYRVEGECAMTSGEYIANLQELRDEIASRHPGARFMFIAPWPSTDGDAVSVLGYSEKAGVNREYSEALESWAAENGDVFADASDYISRELEKRPQSYYLVDYIHPNATHGVQLYSAAVLAE